jgi:hypothetical protein
MAIDDPVEIALRQTREEIEAESYLPARLAKLGLSAALASQLARWPFIVQILTSLLSNASTRLERRLLVVAEELNAQQKRIEDKIPDMRYYESEEFHSLLSLVMERLNTTHDEEKLRIFGDALANSGSAVFVNDDREEYIRTLRELSLKDLRVLNDPKLKAWTPLLHEIKYDPEILSSLARLEGMGLVLQHLKIKTPRGTTGSAHIDAEVWLNERLTTPPIRTYSLSPFGTRFLEFISNGSAGGPE